MALQGLTHFTVRAADLEATRDFYAEVLGLAVGPRPPFDMPGYWLYLGGTAVVHLLANDAASAGPGTGALDHIAFDATGLSAMESRLTEKAVPFRRRTVPGAGLVQLMVDDPNGVTIELTYPAEEGAA